MTLRYFPSSLVDSIIEASKKTKKKAAEPAEKQEKYVTKEAEAALEKVTNFAISKINDSFNADEILKITVPSDKRDAVENIKKTVSLVATAIVDELTKKVFDPNIDKDVSEKEDVAWTAESFIKLKTSDLNTAISSIYRLQSQPSRIPTDTFLRSVSKALSEKIADGFSKDQRSEIIASFWNAFSDAMSKVDTSDDVEKEVEEELPLELPAAQEEDDITSLKKSIEARKIELEVAKEKYKKSPNETNKKNIENITARLSSLENSLTILTRMEAEDIKDKPKLQVKTVASTGVEQEIESDYFEDFKGSVLKSKGDFIKTYKKLKDEFLVKFRGGVSKPGSSKSLYVKIKSVNEVSLTLRNSLEALEKGFKGEEKNISVPSFNVEIKNDKTSGIISVIFSAKNDTELRDVIVAIAKTPAGSNLLRNQLTDKIDEAHSFVSQKETSAETPATSAAAPVVKTKEKIGNVEKTVRKLDSSTFEDLISFVSEAEPKTLEDYNVAIDKTANYFENTKKSIADEILELNSTISSIEQSIKVAEDVGETSEADDLKDDLKQVKISKQEKEKQEKEINEKISRLQSLNTTLNVIPSFAKQKGELLFVNPQNAAVKVAGDYIEYLIETQGKEYNDSTATTATFTSNQDAKTVEAAIESLIKGIRKVVVREKQEDETDRSVLGGVKIELRFNRPSFIVDISYNKIRENLLADELAKMPESSNFRSAFTKKSGGLNITKRVATSPVIKPVGGEAAPMKSTKTPKGTLFQYGDSLTTKEKSNSKILQITKVEGSKLTNEQFNKFVESFVNNIKAQKTSENFEKITINAREFDKDNNPLFQIDVTYLPKDLPYINRAKQASLYESDFGVVIPQETKAKPVAAAKPEELPMKPPAKAEKSAEPKAEPIITAAPQVTKTVAVKAPAMPVVTPAAAQPAEPAPIEEPVASAAVKEPVGESEDDLNAELESLKLDRDALDAQLSDVERYTIDPEERSSQIEEIEKQKLRIDKKMRDIVNQLEVEKATPTPAVTEPEPTPAVPKEKPAAVEPPEPTTATPPEPEVRASSAEVEKLAKLKKNLEPIANLWRSVKQKGGNAIMVSNALRKASEQIGDPEFAKKLFNTAKELV